MFHQNQIFSVYIQQESSGFYQISLYPKYISMSAEFSIWVFLIEVTVHNPESCPENCTLAFSNHSIGIFKRLTQILVRSFQKKKIMN